MRLVVSDSSLEHQLPTAVDQRVRVLQITHFTRSLGDRPGSQRLLLGSLLVALPPSTDR